MAHSNSRSYPGACAVAASVFLVVSCTSAGGAARSAPPSPSAPSASRTTTASSEKQLTEQAQAALAAVHSGAMVEAGAERAGDGVHTEPSLSEGRTYRLSLVCFGGGSARLAFVPASAGAKTEVPCDQSVVRQRITAGERVHIDVDGAAGATGVIAWQVDAV